jgi:hypothetical protein
MNKFQPVSEVPSFLVATAPSPPTKECHYCGEQVLASARKCRYCGEVLDVALRAAEEAKSMVRNQAAMQPLVINNNVSSSATAVVHGGAVRTSLMRSFIRFIVVSIGLILFGSFLAAGGAPDAGVVLAGLGGLLLMVGVPIYLIRGVWRVLFG